jgi:hypothetical protein
MPDAHECCLQGRGIANRLEEFDMSGQGRGGMVDHRLAEKRQVLLGGRGTEPAAGACRDQDGCNSHRATVAARAAAVNVGLRPEAEGCAVCCQRMVMTVVEEAISALHFGLCVGNLPK